MIRVSFSIPLTLQGRGVATLAPATLFGAGEAGVVKKWGESRRWKIIVLQMNPKQLTLKYIVMHIINGLGVRVSRSRLPTCRLTLGVELSSWESNSQSTDSGIGPFIDGG